MRRARLWLAAVVALMPLGAAQSPDPTPPPPVFELHRTDEARHLDPTTANPLFVLVMGSDIREGDPRTGRADAIQLVAVNTQTGQGTIVGIPRDAWVNIPGRGMDKINAALYYGGPQLLAQTVGELSGLPIHYWATVEFSRFRQLVDALGGVTIDIPYPMYDSDAGTSFDPGPRHLTGTEALAFTRQRKGIPGGDFGRSENQGRMLIAGLVKFRQEVTDPFSLLRWLRAFHSFVVTDVPIRELLHLGLIGQRVDPAGVRNVVLQGGTGEAGGQSVVFLTDGGRPVFDAIRDDALL